MIIPALAVHVATPEVATVLRQDLDHTPSAGAGGRGHRREPIMVDVVHLRAPRQHRPTPSRSLKRQPLLPRSQSFLDAPEQVVALKTRVTGRPGQRGAEPMQSPGG